MTYDLFDITLKVAEELSIVQKGIATAGAVGTLTDANDLLGVFSDDHWNHGTVWIEYDAAGAGAAPEGEFTRISDFVGSTGVVTFRDNLTVAPGAGDWYAIANQEYRLDTIISAVNRVLVQTMVETEDIASITTAGDQTEYDLPAALLDQNLDVYIQGKTDDTDDYKWQPMDGWYIRQQAAGTQKKLVFKVQPPYPYLLRLVYYVPHAPLRSASDQLHEYVDFNALVMQVVVELLRRKRNQPGVHVKDLERRIDEATAKAERAKWNAGKGRVHLKLPDWGESFISIEIED